jgi:hypothetical protein
MHYNLILVTVQKSVIFVESKHLRNILPIALACPFRQNLSLLPTIYPFI